MKAYVIADANATCAAYDMRRYDMERLSVLLGLCVENSQRARSWVLVFVVVSLNKLLNKQLGVRWFETKWLCVWWKNAQKTTPYETRGNLDIPSYRIEYGARSVSESSRSPNLEEIIKQDLENINSNRASNGKYDRVMYLNILTTSSFHLWIRSSGEYISN